MHVASSFAALLRLVSLQTSREPGREVGRFSLPHLCSVALVILWHPKLHLPSFFLKDTIGFQGVNVLRYYLNSHHVDFHVASSVFLGIADKSGSMVPGCLDFCLRYGPCKGLPNPSVFMPLRREAWKDEGWNCMPYSWHRDMDVRWETVSWFHSDSYELGFSSTVCCLK